MRIKKFFIPVFFVFIFTVPSLGAGAYSYNDNNTVIGLTKTYKVKDNESLIEIARKFGLGYNEIVDANPDLDAFVPGVGMSVKIPTSWILPDVDVYDGIVINLSEMRLYYFFEIKGIKLVKTFPVGIGSEVNNTPVGRFKVVKKTVNPSWYVPESIRKKKSWLPKVIPPGSGNPLGSHALKLSLGDVLIHGTNRPWSIGRKATHGCIRMYPEDISELFRLVPEGAEVNIVQQPIKVGIRNDKMYIEVHKDEHEKNIDYFNETIHLLSTKNLLKKINLEKLHRALQEKNGIPIEISNWVIRN
jgi:L,D-transpeptidase ErfK/SrfK